MIVDHDVWQRSEIYHDITNSGLAGLMFVCVGSIFFVLAKAVLENETAAQSMCTWADFAVA